jgi:shikimate kinase
VARALAEGVEGLKTARSTERIYLVGFMGSGKTSVGRLLSARRRVPFVDLDQAFETMAGQTVREVFRVHGEPWFRERETELLRGTATLPAAVVAAGGGTFTFPANREFIATAGISVFLDVPFAVIERRLAGKAADRPLFRSVTEAFALYESRLPSYRMADLVVKVGETENAGAVAFRVDEALCAT